MLLCKCMLVLLMSILAVISGRLLITTRTGRPRVSALLTRTGLPSIRMAGKGMLQNFEMCSDRGDYETATLSMG
jgi:hypothetical protein